MTEREREREKERERERGGGAGGEAERQTVREGVCVCEGGGGGGGGGGEREHGRSDKRGRCQIPRRVCFEKKKRGGLLLGHAGQGYKRGNWYMPGI